MSWDVALIKTKTNQEKLDEIKETVSFSKTEFMDVLTNQYPSTIVNDSSWIVMDTEKHLIEFNIGKEENIDCIMMHIRRSDPREVIEFLCVTLQCRAIDISKTAFIDSKKATSFETWQKFKDKVIGNIKK
ncbi:hypothetical protein AUQ54_15470 [Listeria monocytogenes]|nr:hypothetical protein [Listeria monocytogenes]